MAAPFSRNTKNCLVLKETVHLKITFFYYLLTLKSFQTCADILRRNVNTTLSTIDAKPQIFNEMRAKKSSKIPIYIICWY